MRYELKKLLWRRDALILIIVLIGYIAFLVSRIDPRGTCTTVEAGMQVFEEHQQEMIETVIGLRNRAATAPTAYIKADFEKAYECYNVKHSFEPFDTIAVNAGLTLCGFWEVTVAFLVFVTALVSPVLARERECGMYQLLYTTKGGRARLFGKKLMAAGVAVCIVSVIFTAAVFICVWQRRGLSYASLLAPVQSLNSLWYCPFRLTILGYLALLCAVRALTAMLAVALIFLFSAFIKNSFAVMGAAAGAVGLLYALPIVFEGADYVFSKIGLFRLLDLQACLSEYDTTNVIGRPIFTLTLSLCFTAVLTACICAIAYNIFCHERRAHRAA